MKTLTLLAAVTMALVALPAQAADFDTMRELLEERHEANCILKNPKASREQKAEAMKKTREASNKLGMMSMQLMSSQDDQVKYMNMESEIGNRPCTDAASKASASKAVGDIDGLVEELRRGLCHVNATSDWGQRGIRMGAVNETRRKIKDALAAMKSAGNTEAAERLDSQVRKIEMNPGGDC